MTPSLFTQNHYGTVFPTEKISDMAKILGIQAGDTVIDIGGGGSPLPEASVVLEYDLSSGHHRDFIAPPVDNRWIIGDVQNLPFADKAFDFAYCSHVLEHVIDPIRACKEIMRVASRGYIEVPHKMTELYHGHPTHRWLVDIKDSELIFEPRWFVENPLQNIVLAHILNYPSAYQRFLVEYRNLSCIQFYWEKSFSCRIIELTEKDLRFNYDNPEHAGWAHYFFSLNLLANGAPPEFVKNHTKRALKLLPNEKFFYFLDGVVMILLDQSEKGIDQLKIAQQLGCNDQALRDNIDLYTTKSQAKIEGVYLPMQRGWITMKSSEAKFKQLYEAIDNRDKQINLILNSKSWRYTAPFRNILRKFRMIYSSKT